MTAEAERITDRCTYNPWDLADMSLGAHRCPVCGCVVIAGFVHGPCTDVGCPHYDAGEDGRLLQRMIEQHESVTGEPVTDWARKQMVGAKRQVADLGHPLVSCLRSVEWQLNQDGWHNGGPYFPSVYGLNRVGHRLAARNLRVPKELWKAHDTPGDALGTLVRICETETATFRRHLSAKAVGIAFATEAWGVIREAKAVDELQPWGNLRRIGQHPDRIELRTIHGVLVDGTVSALERLRGKTPEPLEIVSGVIPERLAELGRWLRTVHGA